MSRIALSSSAAVLNNGVMEHDDRKRRAEAAMALSADGDHTTATDLVIDLVAEDPTCPAAHRAWGRVLLDQERFSDAVAAYRGASQMSVNDAEVQFELAYALMAQANMEPFVGLSNCIEAGEAVNRGLALDPANTVGASLIELIEARREMVLA